MNKILIIEDDIIMRNMMAQLLVREGYTVLPAVNGDEAAKHLEKESFDLVITDIVMPQKDGIEIIMFLKRRKISIPIIAMSGGGQLSPKIYLEMAQKLGAKFTFQKPFDNRELIKAVKVCLQK